MYLLYVIYTIYIIHQFRMQFFYLIVTNKIYRKFRIYNIVALFDLMARLIARHLIHRLCLKLHVTRKSLNAAPVFSTKNSIMKKNLLDLILQCAEKYV